MVKPPSYKSYSRVWVCDQTGEIVPDIYAAVENDAKILKAVEIGDEDGKIVGDVDYAQIIIPILPEVRHEDPEGDREAQTQK